MSLAASDLCNTDIRILDIAMKYGYDSPEAFTRSFQTIYNTTPSSMRKLKTSFIPFPSITLSVEVEKMDSDNFRNVIKQTMEDVIGGISIKIIKMGELEFIGKIKKDGMSQIKAFWDESHGNGFTGTLYKLQENFRDFGLFINSTDYMIGIEKPAVNYDPDAFDSLVISESLWAIAYGKFGSGHINAAKCWGMIEQYLKNTIYSINEELPVIEKFPDGAEPLDQTYMLMKPIINKKQV